MVAIQHGDLTAFIAIISRCSKHIKQDITSITCPAQGLTTHLTLKQINEVLLWDQRRKDIESPCQATCYTNRHFSALERLVLSYVVWGVARLSTEVYSAHTLHYTVSMVLSRAHLLQEAARLFRFS